LGPLLALAIAAFAPLPQRRTSPPAAAPLRPRAGDRAGPRAQEPAPPAAEKKAGTIGLGAPIPTDSALVRGLTDQRFQSALESLTNTSIGGYGEIQVRGNAAGRDGDTRWTADVARLVVFVAHTFTNDIRAYTELEVEHSVSCPSCPGAVELEQAYLDWRLWGDYLGLRAGLVLVPMGIVNQWHEPPIFHGVTRPRVETVIIPSTWREVSIGLFGRPVDGLRYEVYAMTALNPLGISAGGLGGARQNGALASAKAWAPRGRVEYEPILGAVLGAAFYAADAGKNADYYLRDQTKVDVSVPLLGWAIDARIRRSGLELKALFAEWRLPGSEALMRTFDAAGNARFADPLQAPRHRHARRLRRGRLRRPPPPRLLPPAPPLRPPRVLRHPGPGPHRLPEEPHPRHPRVHLRRLVPPHPAGRVQGDYQLRNRRLGLDERQINFGVGFMY
jgi:hypothetical protein